MSLLTERGFGGSGGFSLITYPLPGASELRTFLVTSHLKSNIMGLKGIIAVSGLPGLYKVLAQTKTGFIVESLTDKKRQPVSATQRVSMLEDISVFTVADDMPLKEVFLKMKEYAASNEIADAKADPAKLRDFLGKVIPDYDQERVYPSDIKKMISWFHMVKDFVDVPDEEETEEASSDTTESTGEKE